MESLIEELGVDVASKTIQRGIKDLRRLGVRRGGVLLVHSSYKSVRSKAKSIENVITALAMALDDEGSLLFPALTYEHVNRHSPVFDVARTPSNVGAIPEFYRKMAVTKRSIHPTHSVCAYGAEANAIVSGHEHDRTPVGPNSPFRKLKNHGGQLLMLGCGLNSNTSMHGIEEIAKDPYVLGPPVAYTLEENGRRNAEYRYIPHAFNGWQQRYDRIKGVLSAPLLARGQVFGTEAWLIEVSALWSTCTEIIKKEPYYFVERT